MVVLYCFISFIIGAMMMLFAMAMAAMAKDREPRNKVHFYIRMDAPQCPFLYLKGKKGKLMLLASAIYFHIYNLNPEDFADMKKGEIREVFLNLED